MRKQTTTQTATGTWAADSTIAVDVERVGLITRIDLNVQVTPSATLKAANQPDGLWRLVRNVEVLGGGHTYITVPDDDACAGGTLLHYMARHDGHGIGHEAGGLTAPSQVTVPVGFVLHPGSRPRDPWNRDNPFDLSAFIPASQESQLRLEWSVSGNDVMDDTVTITSAVLSLTLHRVTGTHAEIWQEMRRQRVILPRGAIGMVPEWTAQIAATTVAATNYSYEVDVSLGAYLKRINMICQDATATKSVRAADEVEGIRIHFPESGENMIRGLTAPWTQHMDVGTNLEADDAVEDFITHAPEGIYLVDMRSYGQGLVEREYGLDLRGLATGTVKLGMTVANWAAGDDYLILWERLQPYVGALANS